MYKCHLDKVLPPQHPKAVYKVTDPGPLSQRTSPVLSSQLITVPSVSYVHVPSVAVLSLLLQLTPCTSVININIDSH